ncbi:unnamed protein product [Rotaria socialis]|uniref:DDE Tnp4 domain-containing protein n=1 Tax=Rotaria socialis TaxID=392032 RepID=A0A818VP99_9BILA|nr:unnamed protein product [Rotaria socialis]
MKDIEPTCSLEEHAKKIEQAIKIIVEATVPAKITTKKPWISEETLKLADEKRRLKQLRNVSLEYAQQYKGLCRKVKRSARQDKEHWIQDQCEQAEKGLNIGNTREAYGLIKMLRKEFVPRLNVIRNQEGTMLQTKDDIKRRWTQYCSSLYKDPGGGDGMVKELEDIAPPGEEVPQDILYSEVQAAINSLKRNKSPGSDGITAEMLQAGGEPLSREIHKLCNKAWHEGTIPEEWGKSILVPIPKKDVTQLDIPLCNTCYRYYSRQMRAASINATDYSMESDFGGTSKTFANASSQTEDSNVTILTRSDSVNMIVDTPATIDVTASVTTSTVVSKSSSSVASPASISFCCLPTSHGRCSICHVEFSCNSSTLVSSNDVRAPAFLEHDILIVFGSRCCVKHIDSGYLNAGALQRIRNNENKCYLCVEEFVNIFTIVKNEFLLKASTIKELNNAPPLNFDDLTSLTSDNYYVLTGLNRVDFDDLCSRIPSPALRSTHNRSARTAIACLLMKLRLGISNQVLATLFSFNDKRTVSHVVHSARKVLVEYFVPNFLGFEHIKRRDVINLHTRPLASELLAGQSDRAILILDGTYIYCQKSANNLLQRRTYSMHKGRPLVKPMLITTTTGYIVSCMGPYFADYKNNDAEITKHIIYLANRLLIK